MAVRKKKGSADPSFFDLPVQDLRSGWYSDKYFTRTKDILKRSRLHPRVTMQVFCRSHAVLCGVGEVLAVLRACSDRPKELRVRTLYDGAHVKPWESVMHISGDYSSFAHLETIYLGILSRRTSVATAVRNVVDQAGGKEVLFFSSRFDHFSNQPGDGYAALTGGASSVSTDANGAWCGQKGVGTVPHGLIAASGGDTVKALLAFDQRTPKSVKRIALVDFDNDCVDTSLRVARALGRKLWGVRLDTAGDLWDRSIKHRTLRNRGVSIELVRNVRRALDRGGFRWVKIMISGGFTAERLAEFKRSKVPFDAVGVGAAFFRERVEFTADIVQVNGLPCAKVGRKFRPNRRLKWVTFQ